jgi:ABC-type sugar transport system permease subunit
VVASADWFVGASFLSASFAAASAKFVGLDNYIRAFQDQEFRISLVNVFWYFVVVTTLQTIGAILLAVLLNAKLRGMRIYRTMLYAPSVASAVVMSLIFLWLYLRTGFINYILGTNISWLSSPRPILAPIYAAFGVNAHPWLRLLRAHQLDQHVLVADYPRYCCPVRDL